MFLDAYTAALRLTVAPDAFHRQAHLSSRCTTDPALAPRGAVDGVIPCAYSGIGARGWVWALDKSEKIGAERPRRDCGRERRAHTKPSDPTPCASGWALGQVLMSFAMNSAMMIKIHPRNAPNLASDSSVIRYCSSLMSPHPRRRCRRRYRPVGRALLRLGPAPVGPACRQA